MKHPFVTTSRGVRGLVAPNMEPIRAYRKQYHKANRDTILRKRREYRKKNRNRLNRVSRASGLKARQETIRAYGGKCVCCGEQDECFLTIDHAHNDGAKHMHEGGIRKTRLGGGPIYRWLRKHGYPQDGRFQLLCYNCNLSKHHDPVGHRAAHPNAINIDNLGDLDQPDAAKIQR